MVPLVVLFAFVGQMKGEPKVTGRPMQFWIGELKNKNPLYCEEALGVLADLGEAAKEALPLAEKLLEDEKATVRRRAALAVAKLGGSKKHAALALAEDVASDDYQRQSPSLAELTKLGPDAAPAIPSLLPLMDRAEQTSITNQIPTLIGAIGKAAVPVLIETLQHRDAKVRARAAFMLSWPANRSKDPVPALQKLLDDKDERVRMRAAWALWENEERGEKVLKLLVEGFGEEEPTLRRTILQSLVQLDPRPKEAGAIYKAAIREKDNLVRVMAASGLWDLEKNTKEVVPALKEVLAPDVREPFQQWKSALPLIRRMGPDARDLVPDLLVRLRSPEGQTVIEIGLTLIDIGTPAVEPLLDLLGGQGAPLPPSVRGSNPALQPMLARILAVIGKPAVEDADDRLGAMDPRMREAACRVLAVAGPEAKGSLKKLIAALKDGDAEVRRYAAKALGNLGDDAKDAVEALGELADHENPDVRVAAYEALTRIKFDPNKKLALAFKARKDTSAAAQVAGVELMWQADPKHGDLLPAINELLEKDAAHATLLPLLRRMGADAREAVPALVKLFRRNDGALAMQVGETLAVIGKGHKDTVPALLQMLTRKVYSGGMDRVFPALLAVSENEKEILAPLIKEMRYIDPAVPPVALYELLARFKGEAKEAAKELLNKAQASHSWYERILAARALREIAPDTFKDELMTHLKGTFDKPRNGGAAFVLWYLEPQNKDAFKAVQEAFQEHSLRDRGPLIEALYRLGPDAKAFLTVLEENRKPHITYNGITSDLALWRLSGKREYLDRAIPSLVGGLTGDPQHAWRTAPLLEDIGPAAKGMVPALLLLTCHTSPAFSKRFERAFLRIDPETAARVGIR